MDRVNCSSCTTQLRPTDRHCPKCGAPANLRAAAPPIKTATYNPPSGRRYRVSDFLIAHAKALIVVLIVGGIAVTATTGSFSTKTVPEDPSSPGYKMVRALQSAGKIERFKAVEPDSSWATEYDLNDGEATIRFSGSRMQISYRHSVDTLKTSIEDEARAEGFTTQ